MKELESRVGTEEFDTDRAIRILNNPVRIRIIELLGSKGPLSWKELSGQLGTSTGSLYHHLDTLERMVTQDSSKRYVLTKLGRDVHDYLNRSSWPRSTQSINKLVRQRSAPALLRGLFIPRSLIYFLTSTKSKSIASSIGVSLVVLVLMILSKNQVVLFSFSPSQGALQPAESFAASLLVLTALTYVGIRSVRAKPDAMVLLTSISLAFLPLAVFSLTLRGLAALGYLGFLTDRNVLTIVFVFFQAWGAGIVGAGMSVAAGLRIEKTLIASLILLYATAIIMLIQGVRFI